MKTQCGPFLPTIPPVPFLPGEKVAAGCKTGDDTISAWTTGTEENTIDKAGHLRAKVDKAFENLVRNATEQVGFAPRDVYDCFFHLDSTKAKYASEVNRLTYLDLQRIIRASIGGCWLPQGSDLVVAVWPRKLELHHVEWDIGFKSNRIAKMVATAIWSTEDIHLQHTYDVLCNMTEDSVMTRRLLEAFAHRISSTC